MHIVKEHAFNFPVVLLIQKESIYKNHFNKQIEKIVEGGFYTHWVETEIYRATQAASMDKKQRLEIRSWTLKDASVPFVLICSGLALTLTIFLVEFGIGK